MRYSKYLSAKGTVITFTDTDQLDRLEQNIKLYPELETRTVNYTINSLGFRGKEWQGLGGVMSLGCSMTFGVGVDDREVWPYLVSEKLGLENYNLGQGGAGPDTAFRLACFYIGRLLPRYVIYLEPPSSRIELLDYEGKSIVLSSQDHADYKDYYTTYASNRLNQYLNQLKNRHALKQLCQEHKSEFYHFTWKDIDHKNQPVQSLGRDLMHPGREHHLNFAKQVLEVLGPAAQL